jgi:hypothetical protein
MNVNEIIGTATNFQHLLKPNESKTLKEFGKIISKAYSIENKKTKLLCYLLDLTEGTIEINRHGSCFLRYRKL